MRISTGMIFDAGVRAINRQATSLLHIQQQIASGRRVLSPGDDPIAAAQALEVTQANDVIAQFTKNHASATTALSLEETQLTGAIDLLATVRDLALQSSNPSLTASGRAGIASALRARFDQLLGIANAADGAGQHMFAGFMGGTTPFAGSVDNLLAGNEIVYQGDSGQRKLQVSSGRYLEVGDAGNDVFMRIRNGNGTFTTDYAGTNTGTGTVGASALTNPAAWNAASTRNVAINFTVTAGVTSYDLVDTVSGTSLLTGLAAPAPLVSQRVFQSGQPIALGQAGPPAFDLGGSITINGAPATGDSFSVAPSTSQSVFVTLANLVGALEAPTGTPAAGAKYSSDLASAVANIDQATNNIVTARARVGLRLNEIDSLGSLNSAITLQYQQTLSNLQDIDYTKAISDLTRTQTGLEAAQQSFVKISQLSLFNYL